MNSKQPRRFGRPMTKSSLLALACLAAVSITLATCTSKQQRAITDTPADEADSLFLDSLESAADTLLLDIETAEVPLPETVDELFNDFLFSFDQSNRLQRSRIRFPLPVVGVNGETTFLQRRDWQHHYLLLHRDFCTVLWNTRRQFSMAQDTTVSEARVDQIYLHSRMIESFVFQRDSVNGLWMLTELCKIPFGHTDLAPFLDFYREFTTDSAFQRRHVSDPLKYVTIDAETYEPTTGSINADQWFEFQPEMPADVLINIAYGQTYNDPRRMILQLRGISNGMESILGFIHDGHTWRLRELEN